MDRFALVRSLLLSLGSGWRLCAVWLACLASIIFLGGLRAATDAEFAFATLALLPVLLITWIAGSRHGVLMALMAAGMWTASDFLADRQFSAPWIPWANSVMRMFTFALIVALVAQARASYLRANAEAGRDSLTGLSNRRAFFEIASVEVGRAKRYGKQLAVLFLDLDHFKQLNDQRGHHVGDDALRATARALLHATRTSDIVARLGGDEFAVVLPEIEYSAAVTAGRKLFDAVNSGLDAYAPVRASMGLAWFATADRSFTEMLKVADELMYQVKQEGKNDFVSKCCAGRV